MENFGIFEIMLLGGNMLGKYLKYMRTTRGFSQKALAEKLFIATSTLSHYEVGTRMMPFPIFLKVVELCDYDLKIIDCLSGKDITNSAVINEE